MTRKSWIGDHKNTAINAFFFTGRRLIIIRTWDWIGAPPGCIMNVSAQQNSTQERGRDWHLSCGLEWMVTRQRPKRARRSMKRAFGSATQEWCMTFHFPVGAHILGKVEDALTTGCGNMQAQSRIAPEATLPFTAHRANARLTWKDASSWRITRTKAHARYSKRSKSMRETICASANPRLG